MQLTLISVTIPKCILCLSYSTILIGGSISYYSEVELSNWSQGVVYKGRFGRHEKRSVAVKVIKCSNNQDAKETHKELQNIYKEIEIMDTFVTPADKTHIIH